VATDAWLRSRVVERAVRPPSLPTLARQEFPMSVVTVPPAAPATDSTRANEAPELRAFVFALFFLFGGITSLNDVLIPKLKDLFTLSYAQVMLVQSAFFAAYFFISIPGAAIVRRIGYMRTAVVGLLVMTVGCLLFVPASGSGLFFAFLAALFVLASGITIVQVVANPLIDVGVGSHDA
jgi:FHS family L-fucose permease-like MFS transporter